MYIKRSLHEKANETYDAWLSILLESFNSFLSFLLLAGPCHRFKPWVMALKPSNLKANRIPLVNTVPVDMARGWKGSNMFEQSRSQNEEYHGLPEHGNVQMFSDPKWEPHDKL